MYEQTKKIWENESYKEGLERPPPTIKEFVHVRIEIRGPMLDNPGKIPFFKKAFCLLHESYSFLLCRIMSKHWTCSCEASRCSSHSERNSN